MNPCSCFFALPVVAIALAQSASAQTLTSLGLSTTRGVQIHSMTLKGEKQEILSKDIPLFSLLVNDTLSSSSASNALAVGDSTVFTFARGLRGSVRAQDAQSPGWQAFVRFQNTSADTLTVANIVPLGEGPDRTYITATGPTTYIYRLSRSALFRPGLGPIGVILPDNAWEMGFCDVALAPAKNLVAIARRIDSEGAEERRFKTLLAPGGWVRYVIHADSHGGDWHEGVQLMFHERYLYDLASFNDSLFQRKDLEWIRHTYLMTLLFAWDEQYYDRFEGHYTFEKFLDARKSLLGPYDAFMIWPTWPRLGVDERNQFDMYRDMPGGLAALRRQADTLHARGGKFFIAYNPWDESTRKEEHLRGMEDLLRRTNGDGVVLDTWGESSREFQAAADRVKSGIILYSEGMAVVKDMPGIVAGRVHDALYMPPPLNMNKVIKPEFAIFRVMQVQEGRLHREAALCLFNGYGAELNVMRTGRPDWMEEEYRYLGRIVKILRDNSTAFVTHGWTPLIPTGRDSVWVNRWPTTEKTLFTVYGLRPEGFNGPLFEGPASSDRHYVSLYHHAELEVVASASRTLIPATVDGFSRAWLSSRREGNVDCIASLPRLLETRLQRDSLFFRAARGTKIVVTAGNPAYDRPAVEFTVGPHAVSLYRAFGRYEGKFVVQLFDSAELLDERIETVELGTPRLVSAAEPTRRTLSKPEGMTELPAGRFTFAVAPTDVPNPVIPYPDHATPREVTMSRLYIDTYPVTNAQFQKFLRESHYRPKDTTNFLRHWTLGRMPRELSNHPVVWVSLEDARAYGRWSGKRLPSGIEWQYAAQGTDGRTYPWGSTFDSTRCNSGRGRTTPVDAYPSGKSPFGVMDMVGNVWQLTNDTYDNGSYYFVTMRGGSYYNPSSSIWYVQGGPWSVNREQMLLLLSPGFDRSATVGFRCVKDADAVQPPSGGKRP